jgi:hypothetical protein
MWNIFKSSFISDINIILHDKTLLARILAPFILILLLKLVFPLLSGVTFSKTGFLLDKYYSLIAITFVSVIPMFPGMVYAFIQITEKDSNTIYAQTIATEDKYKCKFLLLRMTIAALISFILVMITIILVKPVPTEGWLRNLFAAGLLSIQTAFVFQFIRSLSVNRVSGLAVSRLYWIFILTVPLGLLFHHPWNYLAFFSPLYWISWAWVVPNPAESFVYGAIASILTSGSILLLLRQFIRRFTV